MNKQSERRARFLLSHVILAGALLLPAALKAQPEGMRKAYDISKEKVLYTIGYAHLDTQWNWDYVTSIEKYLRNTLDENFYLFEKYPAYVFNFTGSRRYQMMKEYFPARYERMKQYIRDGRWYVSGSSVDEGEVNISSSESVVRQVLYGNHYFKREFGVTSVDYMLPDCFGFLANLPTVWNHCGLLGFSTQKLTWGSAAGLPFNVGVWKGVDDKGIIAALNATSYGSSIEPNMNKEGKWIERMNKDVKENGLYFDYRYYGVGDMGGSPDEASIKRVTQMAMADDSDFKVRLTSSDQMYRDITPPLRAKLPTYKGDLLLTEHSAGSMTSESFMKRMNRKNELLAQSAEALAVMADYTGVASYPFTLLNNAWELVLGSQMHDILPGTAIPGAYELAWNDEFIAANSFAQVLRNSAGNLAAQMDTRAQGRAVVVYNPVASEREDIVTACLTYDQLPADIAVYNARGARVPSQVIAREGNKLRFIFNADMPSLGLATFDVRPLTAAANATGSLKVTDRTLENAYYRVTLADNGDIASIYDKQARKELLKEPAKLEFQKEAPREWPAWNMDWTDRQQPPFAYLNEQASLKVTERGPVRVTIEVTRKGQNSSITQRISLAAGTSGKRVEVDNLIDWQSTGVSLKAAFPLTVANSKATYNLGVGTIDRTNNDPKKYEVPAKEWFDLTDARGNYGVTILEDCKYGSDKPADNTVRLTLMYTPTTRRSYRVQNSQDWGIHQFRYGIYGHRGSWQDANAPQQGEQFNRPLLAFEVDKHVGKWGKSLSLLNVNNSAVGVMAFKKAEEGDYYIVRLNELKGRDQRNASLSFLHPIEDAYEVNGQEQRIGDAKFSGKALKFDLSHYTLRTFAVKFKAEAAAPTLQQQTVDLPYNKDVLSYDENKRDGDFMWDRSYPAELMPDVLKYNNLQFKMGGKQLGEQNAVRCLGQEIDLPAGKYTKLYFLAAADQDEQGDFRIGDASTRLDIQSWRGYIGQHYARQFGEDRLTVKALHKAFVKKAPIAWFASHQHQGYPGTENLTYQYCYLYIYELAIPEGATKLRLPDNGRIKILAATVANDTEMTTPLQPLYDNFEQMKEVAVR